MAADSDGGSTARNQQRLDLGGAQVSGVPYSGPEVARCLATSSA